MAITVDATFENGQLKFKEPVVLAEGTPVRVTITPLDADDPLAGVVGACNTGRTDGAENHDKYIYGEDEPEVSSAERTAGMLQWKGDAATFDHLLRESEVDFWDES
jgi:predicted DNA-binding antitoxin AbrB/MazE fold protein